MSNAVKYNAKCDMCGLAFISASNNAKYCPACGASKWQSLKQSDKRCKKRKGDINHAVRAAAKLGISYGEYIERMRAKNDMV